MLLEKRKTIDNSLSGWKATTYRSLTREADNPEPDTRTPKQLILFIKIYCNQEDLRKNT